jgi:tripartite-type tricarboxylate transporter receptor subunit TctC
LANRSWWRIAQGPAALNKEINKVIEDPDVKTRLEGAGAVVTPMAVYQFKDFVQNESAKYLRVIKQTGVTSQ